MIQQRLYELLEDLLTVSRHLEQVVTETLTLSDEEAEMDSWVDILVERQQLIDQLEQLVQQGASISEHWKRKVLVPVSEIDRKLKPLIEAKKAYIQSRIQKISLGKKVTHQYNPYEVNAYGAFFDLKK
jgi:flagellar protein FliT